MLHYLVNLVKNLTENIVVFKSDSTDKVNNLQNKKLKKINNASDRFSTQTSAKLRAKSIVPPSYNSYKKQLNSVNNVTQSNARTFSEIKFLFILCMIINPTLMVIIVAINIYKAKYSRRKFWVWSAILFILFLFMRAIKQDPNHDNLHLRLGIMAILIMGMWISILANRIRDYGSNPYIALWALVPLINVILPFYYGTVQYKKKKDTIQNNQGTVNSSLVLNQRPG